MFYDAHYLFPRAWTQEQAAPGVPQDAPLAFYGKNSISQPFISGVNNLAMVELWLAGAPDEVVFVSLTDDRGHVIGGDLTLVEGREGGNYQLSFPPIPEAKGRRFLLTLAALDSTIEQPVVTRTVGGDWLGGSLQLNEYNRPGNLALMSYARGWPGRWWLEAIGEQMLPSVFRLRLQQYKPAAFKGVIFPFLLVLTILLSIVYLVLARPQTRPSLPRLNKTVGWTVAMILGLFLLWQIVGGRLKLPSAELSRTPALSDSQALDVVDTILEEAPEPSAELSRTPGADFRLIRDIISDLWTLEREPEARFISTERIDGLPAIRVPSDSIISYGLNVPPEALLKAGIAAEGKGMLDVEVYIEGEVINVQEITAVVGPDAEDISWFEVDLSPWSGKAVVIRMTTGSDQRDLEGLWIMPRIESASPWILPDPLPVSFDVQPSGYHFGEIVELVGTMVKPSTLQAGETAVVDLYWRPLQRIDDYATVFIHLLDSDGNLITQHDGQPVNNAYPLPLWQPGSIIRDTHQLSLPPDLPPGQYSLFAGLYDPDTLQRWPVVGPDGAARTDNVAILDTSIEVMP